MSMAEYLRSTVLRIPHEDRLTFDLREDANQANLNAFTRKILTQMQHAKHLRLSLYRRHEIPLRRTTEQRLRVGSFAGLHCSSFVSA